ncbi:hypothetical protein HNR60_001591 [Rhodopseudomonas rhenobacensis]|uniref:Uncharacterized protein n=1 Tax=Rhodopseudomonas rhenobacensis TaxID=87461 RepID=A0A7W7Z382_9BRAD|nr:hypothetical protein [Rhodopseudomonas rhenobacensis]MBB5046842.1 hypothetical protein [Rhodopseudomonas rhenobacensis]
MRNLNLSLLICAAMLAPGVAAAQAPPATAPAQVAPTPQAGSGNCSPSRTAPEQGSITTPDATTGQGREPLGDKLARSDGVLCPPSGVDPEIRAPTPDVGKTPVIPPPGSPGGDPSVRPK